MIVLPGMGWGDASGSVGAVTVSHNKGGLYIRSRTVPTNPNTSFQADMRANIATLSQNWRGLTGAQRTAWEDFSVSNPVVNALGSSISLSGEQSYIRCNQRLLAYGFSLISAPPTTMTVTPVDVATMVFDTAPAFVITLSASQPDDIYVKMTPPLSPGIQNFTKYLRCLGVFDQATLSADVTTAYAARFGTPSAAQAGKRVGLQIAGFGSTNGQISVPLVNSTIAL